VLVWPLTFWTLYSLSSSRLAARANFFQGPREDFTDLDVSGRGEEPCLRLRAHPCFSKDPCLQDPGDAKAPCLLAFLCANHSRGVTGGRSSASAGGDAGAEPAAKRPRTAADFFRKSSRAAAAAVAASSENGLLGEPLARAAGPRITVRLVPAENVVASEWDKFKAGFGFAETTDAYGKPLPEQPLDWGFDGVGFWGQKKLQELYPNLAAAARVVFGHPASAAAIERDFGRAGHPI